MKPTFTVFLVVKRLVNDKSYGISTQFQIKCQSQQTTRGPQGPEAIT